MSFDRHWNITTVLFFFFPGLKCSYFKVTLKILSKYFIYFIYFCCKYLKWHQKSYLNIFSVIYYIFGLSYLICVYSITILELFCFIYFFSSLSIFISALSDRENVQFSKMGSSNTWEWSNFQRLHAIVAQNVKLYKLFSLINLIDCQTASVSGK